jgi:sulfite exporter TauE/SafE
MALWTAFMIGLVGSLHCVGMCGPIALSLPYQGKQRWMAALNVMLYNFGRVITYALLGLIIGIFGRGFFLAGFQSYVSIGLGVLLLFVAFFSIDIESHLLRLKHVRTLNTWVQKQLGRLLSKGGSNKLLYIGMLNGLLPCGLVYMGIVGAVTTDSLFNSALYMVSFGFGTIPLMLSTALAGQFITPQWRIRMRKLIPAFLVAFALLFIFRGLNFDVPIELRFWENMQEAPMCH